MSIEDYLQSVSFVNDTEEEFSSKVEETDVVVEFSNSAYVNSFLWYQKPLRTFKLGANYVYQK